MNKLVKLCIIHMVSYFCIIRVTSRSQSSPMTNEAIGDIKKNNLTVGDGRAVDSLHEKLNNSEPLLLNVTAGVKDLNANESLNSSQIRRNENETELRERQFAFFENLNPFSFLTSGDSYQNEKTENNADSYYPDEGGRETENNVVVDDRSQGHEAEVLIDGQDSNDKILGDRMKGTTNDLPKREMPGCGENSISTFMSLALEGLKSPISCIKFVMNNTYIIREEIRAEDRMRAEVRMRGPKPAKMSSTDLSIKEDVHLIDIVESTYRMVSAKLQDNYTFRFIKKFVEKFSSCLAKFFESFVLKVSKVVFSHANCVVKNNMGTIIKGITSTMMGQHH